MDVTEGFRPQTKEALSILRRNRTPFVVAANKVDRIHGWESAPGEPFMLNVKKIRPTRPIAIERSKDIPHMSRVAIAAPARRRARRQDELPQRFVRVRDMGTTVAAGLCLEIEERTGA